MKKYLDAMIETFSFRYVSRHIGTFIVSVVVALVALYFSNLGGRITIFLPRLFLLLLVVSYGAVLAIIGETIITVNVRERRALHESQLRKREEALSKRVAALTQNHPELIEFLEIQRIEQERQEEAQRRAEQRSFWQGVVQNFIFFILGLLVPVLLTKFHILGQ